MDRFGVNQVGSSQLLFYFVLDWQKSASVYMKLPD